MKNFIDNYEEPIPSCSSSDDDSFLALLHLFGTSKGDKVEKETEAVKGEKD